jgi:hypothetical protein
MSEVLRVSENINGQEPPSVQVRIKAESDSPQEALDRVLSVLIIIIRACSMEWPEDTWWKQELPEWFLGSFNHSTDEILKDASLWDFDSWLDANKYRGWEWWSSNKSSSSFQIKLHALDDPYVIEPLEYLIRVSGGSNIKVDELG